MDRRTTIVSMARTQRFAPCTFTLMLFALVADPATAADCPGSIAATMIDKLDSASATAGQVFRFRTTVAATVDKRAIPAGSIGVGVVRNVDRAGRRDHDGSLALEVRYVTHGKVVVPVTMNPHLPASWSRRDSLIERGASRIPNPVSGIVMTGVNILRYGQNVTLGPGFTFTILAIPSLARKSVCPNA